MNRSIDPANRDDDGREDSYLLGVGKVLMHLGPVLLLGLAAWALIILGAVKLVQALVR